MARSQAGTALTEQHRRRQLALRALTLQEFTRLWPIWQTADAASFERLVEATVPLVQARRADSAVVAGRYYEAYRTAEGVEGSPTLRLAGREQSDRIVSSLYVTGLDRTRKALSAGLDVEQARRTALVSTSGAVTRHVLNGGRSTVIGSTMADSQALGWQRVTAGNPCAFCTMLSANGPSYKSRGTADFQPHDGCACTPEVVYRGGEWNAQNREHRDTYRQAQEQAREAGDLERGTSNDALNALRRFMST